MNQPSNRPRKILAVWATAISLAGALHAQDPAGLWNFTNGDFAADGFGQPLQYAGGAAGTSFGTTTSFEIADIGGETANVMKIDAAANNAGYRMPVSVGANGGGAFVNDYTLVVDVYYPADSAAVKRPLLETDLGEISAGTGVEFYVSDTGEFTGIDNARGSLAAETWYRLGIVVDSGQNQVRLYVNGIEQGAFNGTGVDGRLAINPNTAFSPFAELFKDLSGSTALAYVNSIQFRDDVLTNGEMQALAGPTAGGIPAAIPDVPSFVERWVPSESFARISTGLSVVLNPGSSDLSNFAMTLNGDPLTVTETTVDGLIMLTATGAPELQVLTGYTLEATFVDSAAGNKTFTHDFYVPLMYEDFELVVLGPNVDESLDGDEVYSPMPPTDWGVDHVSKDGQTPLYGIDPIDPDNGITEFRGWTFVNKDWWVETAGDQNRSQFSFGEGTVALADPDEWEDKGSIEGSALGTYNSKLVTPEIDISLAAEGTVFLAFDSSTRSETPQEIYITVSYDNGAETEILRWTADAGPTLKADAPNERLSIPLNNPDGAGTLRITFGMEKALNDWWWAIDNIVVDAGAIPPTITSQPILTIKAIGESATFSVAAEGTEPFDFQWYRGTGAARAPIDGATAGTYMIDNVEADDTDLYSVDVSNGGGTVSSSDAWLYVIPQTTPTGDIAGQWNFDSGDLSATIGADMLYFDGVGGQTAAETEFGTTTALGIPNIGGAPANVMKFAAANGEVGYVAATGGPNGGEGATEKNTYTMIFDVLWPEAANNQWRTFVQIDSLNNGNDGEFFARPSDNGIGVGATGYHGQLTANTWHRVVIVVDQSADINRVSYYIDGQFVGSGAGNGLDGRFGLPAAVNFFADNDGDARAGYVSSLQVRNVALTELQVLALGAATADGIPVTIDASALAPVISMQPQTGFYLSPGGGVALSVEAQSESQLTYQWRFNGTIIDGATDATLELDTLLEGEGGAYTVDVTNPNGTVTSQPAVITLFEDPIETSLVAHLEFEDDLLDASGNGLNGSAVGNVPFADGVIGRAISVSTDEATSSFNYVTLGAPAALDFGTDTDFTVSFWANLVDISSDPALVANKDWGSGSNIGWLIATAGDRRVQWNIAGTGAGETGDRKDYDSAGGVFPAGTWRHVAVVFHRSGTARTYVNGQLIDSRSIAAPVNGLDTADGLATNIGQDGTGTYGAPITEAYLDDVGIWSRRLTDGEVAAIYRGGLAGNNLQSVTGRTLGIISTAEAPGEMLNFDWRGQPGARLQRSIDLIDWTDVPGTEGLDQISIPINPDLNEYFRLILPE